MSHAYFNSVRIDKNACTGCLACVKACLTKAIRVRSGKAVILTDRCIDCGACIRVCPTRAVEGWADPLGRLKDYKVNIALVAPSLLAQIDSYISAGFVWEALREIGFDDVFDVALAGDYVSREMENYLLGYKGPFPVISSVCPAVLRLIQIKYPELRQQVMPVLAPTEAAAIYVRKATTERLGVAPNQVGIWFIAPCPAKGTNIHQSVDVAHTAVTGFFTISSIYGPLMKALKHVQKTHYEVPEAIVGSSYSLNWGTWLGEIESMGLRNVLAAQGTREVDELLEQISLGKLTDVKYVCCYICRSGCVGGPCVAVNRFVGLKNLWQRVQHRRAREPEGRMDAMALKLIIEDFPTSKNYIKALQPKPIPPLAKNFGEALARMDSLKKLEKELPQLDCGACGAPTCSAFAEDVVRGFAKKDDCLFLMRKKNGENT